MRPPEVAPELLNPGQSPDRIVVGGVEIRWDIRAGTCTFQGLPVAMMWVDSTLAGLMSGLATMVGPERFSLALQSEGRKSVEADWQVFSGRRDFSEGFAAIGVIAAVAGWGEWQLLADDPGKRECRFRAFNSWEGLYQRKLGTCWGSAMLAGKLAGYCSKRFGTNCWATQTLFIARGDPCDEFVVVPSPICLEAEIERLLSTDQATRADMAVALARLREAQTQLLTHKETLEQQVRQRTAELAASLDELQKVNERLRIEIDEHTRAEAARSEGEKRLMKIMEHSPMSMAIVGLDGTIEYVNRKAIETFGYLPEDIPNLERWWVQAYPDPDYRRDVIARWTGHVTEAIAKGCEIRRDDYRITCKDGSVKTVTVFGVPVADKVVVMFDDITVRALVEDLLRQSNVELEIRVAERTAELAERNRALQAEVVERRQVEERLIQVNYTLERSKTQLRKLGAELTRVEENERRRMAHILHDQLQQLLVSARIGLSTLERELSDGHMLGTARTAGAVLDDAIHESKSLVLELSPPILREGGLAQAMKWLRQRMLEKHGLTVEVVMDRREAFIGEELRVAIFRAVQELLLNVVKHSGATSAKVELVILPDERVSVAVSDQGRGYAAPRSDHEEQLGFGLFAIRERFESLGGKVTVDSAPGQGFCVTLIGPISLRSGSTHAPSEESAPPAREDAVGETHSTTPPVVDSRIRVLIVDDHTILRQGLVKLLSGDSEIEVVGEAPNGEIAVQLARSLRPSVVLMDVNMPKMNGIEATRAIHAEYPEIVIIGLSMYAELHRAEEMRRAGASAYLSKSKAAEALLATVRSCCRR